MHSAHNLLMAVIPFGEYRPDVSDLNQGFTASIANALPRSDGYGPFNEPDAYTSALPAPCRGYFFARNADRSVTIFAGTDTKLYRLNNTTLQWLDVSLGGSTYTTLDSNRNWRFAQFNNFVFVTQRNAVLQRYDLTSSSAFSNAPGSPPQSGNLAVVNRFLVLCDQLSSPYQITWCGLNDTTNWTAGVNYSDSQTLPSGGVPLAIVGGELGIILQDTEIRRMMFAAGSDIVFQIDRVAENIGILGADAVTTANNSVFAYSTRGFVTIDVSGAVTPIGEERVNRTFLAMSDLTAPQYIIAASDPTANVVMWSSRSASNTATAFSQLWVHNYAINRWAPVTAVSGQYLASMARPGLTLEGLDAIAPGALVITGAADNGVGLIRITVADTSSLTTGDVKTLSSVGGVPNANGTWTITVISGTTFDLDASTFAGTYTSGGTIGGSLDLLPFSLDAVSTATLPALSMATTSNEIAFFTGPALEATLETPEQELDRGYRVDINSVRPVTDADNVLAAVSMRDNLKSGASQSVESASDNDGNCYHLVNTRYARSRLRIPQGANWTYATGVEPSFRRAGKF